MLAAVNDVFAERFEGFAPLQAGRDEERGGRPGRRAAADETRDQAGGAPWRRRRSPPGCRTRRASARGRGASAGSAHTRADRRRAGPRRRGGRAAARQRRHRDLRAGAAAPGPQDARDASGPSGGASRSTDLHSYLRALANPRDEEALYGVAGLAARRALPRRPGAARDRLGRERRGRLGHRSGARGRGPASSVTADRERALAAFCRWFEPRARRRRGPGDRRAARARVWRSPVTGARARPRLARAPARQRPQAAAAGAPRSRSTEGRDLRAFVDHVAELKRAGASEPEAPVEDVEPDTCRLMTIHAAKGLEFPVVCVADLGRKPPNPAEPAVRRRRACRAAAASARRRARATKTLDYEELRAERRPRAPGGEPRLLRRMTRARERLLLSGAVDFALRGRGEAGTAAPISWLGPALCPSASASCGRGGAGVRDRGRRGAEAGGPELEPDPERPAGYGTGTPRPAPAAPARAGGARRRALCRCTARELAPAAAASPAGPRGCGAARRRAELHLADACWSAAGTATTWNGCCGCPSRPPRAGRSARRARGARAGRPRAQGAGDARLRRRRAARRRAARRRGAASSVRDDARGARRGREAIARGARGPARGRRIAASRQAAPRASVRVLPRRRAAPLVTGVIDLLCDERDGTALMVDYKSDRLAAEADARGSRGT